jgi:tetratricopeptide (TPR) repeat protein
LAAELALHFEQGEAFDHALEYHILAGDNFIVKYALAEAISHYTHALRLSLKLNVEGAALNHVYLRLGRSYELGDCYSEAVSLYDEMQQLAETRQDQVMLMNALSAEATIRSTPSSVFDPLKGLALSERVLALAESLEDRAAEARILWNLGLARGHGQGRIDDAAMLFKRALVITRELEQYEQTAVILTDLATLLGSSGRSMKRLTC